ncbi:urea ABC transporter permease subunit UrtB [Alkalilimnicola ehrlichii]|uniref:Urea ABC transporter permease subunit UrtB n=1 Tax=Alkalilimnicola ehrlichii TaxID=351052 RepID=A0A3E0WMP7_9GAMM|nr:urea ABC transporter permease subunit UrtB [Alkalilimnicola ehrlichii]RFA26410.1 urea ABC transporter permease subunit UrtB [Alkalilimnicola ehrlichii]RFA33473.1 urea ABC transporter permease subunit UrtB [Alkalilimnicola ehrlichii]
MIRVFRLLVLLALVWPTLAAASVAEDTQTAAAGLASSNWREVAAALETLAELADPAVLPALQALQNRRLSFDEDGRLYIANAADDTYRDALSGEPVTVAEDALTAVPLNNPVRRILRPVIAQLQIFAEDDKQRLSAAEELAQRPNPAMRETINRALEQEGNAEIERLLNIALATLDLDSESAERRLEAVKLVGSVRASRMKPRLQGLLAQDSDGHYLEPDQRVRDAAETAIAAIESRERTAAFVSDLVFGLSMGSVLLLAALGLAIIFGLMGVINMAHGELLMIGAYTTFLVQTLFATFMPQFFGLYLLAALPIAFLVTGAVGIAMERGVIRFLYNRPLETLLTTFGISLILMQGIRMVFGAQNVRVSSPEWFSGSVQIMQGVSLSTSRVGVIVFAALVVALVWFLMYRTRLGLEVRAVMQNRKMAASLGVASNRVDMWTFGAGAGVAGLGGVALSQIVNVGPELGQGFIVDSFMVVVLGGVGNIFGTVFSALGLGVASKFLEPATGAVLAKIILFVGIILFIQWRPQGLFALKGRSAAD